MLLSWGGGRRDLARALIFWPEPKGKKKGDYSSLPKSKVGPLEEKGKSSKPRGTLSYRKKKGRGKGGKGEKYITFIPSPLTL